MNYALLVGINKYQTSGNDLRGCINDVENMRMLLGDNSFSVMHVRSLINEQATKKRILDSLTQLVSNMKEGDHGVFHFSGHGSQVPCTEGDEEDGFDEILCPHDHDWNGSYIKDDDLRGICEKLNGGATLDAVLDCCHSGTGTREVGDPVARFIPMPPTQTLGDYNPAYMLPVNYMLREMDQPNVALWAGCKSDQTSVDALIGKVYRGAMTWAFCKSISSAPVIVYLDALSREKILKRIVHNLKDDFDQEPQLECCDEMAKRRVFT